MNVGSVFKKRINTEINGKCDEEKEISNLANKLDIIWFI